MQFTDLIKLLDFQIIVTIIIIIIALKWGDWRNWERYYPTILYFIAADFACACLTYNYELWAFESPLLKKTGSEFLITIVFFSATLLVFLPHYPKEKPKQILYILLWVSVYTLIESVSFMLGFFSYNNGWNLGWSALFNMIMFPTLKLHCKNPPLVWLISIIIAFAVLFYFKVPFESMK